MAQPLKRSQAEWAEATYPRPVSSTARVRKPMETTEAWVSLPGIVAAGATVIAAGATVAAAFVACKMLKLERFREENRILFLKHESEVEHLQKLIASFARIVALDSAQWGFERNREIDKAIQEMQFHLSVLGALNTKISEDIVQWVTAATPDRETIAQIVYYQVGQLYSIGHEGRINFFKCKVEDLKKIQDKMYSEMIKE